MASDKPGSGNLGISTASGRQQNQHPTETSDISTNDDETIERPACLPPPSPPSMPPRRTLTDSMIDSTVAKFEAQCLLEKTITSETQKENDGRPVVPPLPPAMSTHKCNGEALERTAQAWIEAVSRTAFYVHGTNMFARNVKTGERLCALVNAIRPGTIDQVHKSQLGYQQMENIDSFLNACCKLGVPTHCLFETIDAFEMKDTAAVVTCVHALGSAVQVSCPRFGGPHLGQPADASAVAEVPSTEDERSQADDDDEDGAFGDFWRASRAGEASGGNDAEVHGHEGLALNMEDVERPRTIRRGFTTTVGSVSDLGPPVPLSARARKMCPDELVNSPRALVYDADPVGHPTRSPTVAASERAGTDLSGRRGWGTDVHPLSMHHRKSPRMPPQLSSTSPKCQTLSPAGLWGDSGREKRSRFDVSTHRSSGPASHNNASDDPFVIDGVYGDKATRRVGTQGKEEMVKAIRDDVCDRKKPETPEGDA